MLEAEDDLEGFGAAGRRRGLAAGAGHAARAWPLQPFDQRGMRLAGRGLRASAVYADEPCPALLWPAPGCARLSQGQGSHLLSLRCREISEEHTSELQSLMRILYAVFCLKINITC